MMRSSSVIHLLPRIALFRPTQHSVSILRVPTLRSYATQATSTAAADSSGSNGSQQSFIQRLKRAIGWNPTPKSVIIGSLMLGTLGFVYWHHNRTIKLRKIAHRQSQAKRTLGGGQFTLIDTNGQEVTESALAGSWTLLYFGFTHCPDICPDELEKISLAVDMLRKIPDAPEVKAVFISVDPQRDTPAAVAKYLKDFPAITGYTGSPEQIRHVCKQFHVYSEPHQANEHGDYIVDHTIITYLITPAYAFVDYYMRTNTADEIVKSVLRHYADYQQLQKKLTFFNFLLPEKPAIPTERKPEAVSKPEVKDKPEAGPSLPKPASQLKAT